MIRHIINHIWIAMALIFVSVIIVLIENYFAVFPKPIYELKDEIIKELISSVFYFVMGIGLYWYYENKESKKS